MPDKIDRTAEHSYNPHIQLVPSPLWKRNLRAIMKQAQWKALREALLEQQGVVCAVCGKVETASQRLQCHEAWEYIENEGSSVARILGASLVCWHCHACEHWERTKQIAVESGLETAIADTMAHFCRHNQVSEVEFREHEAATLVDWNRHNGLDWQIDYGRFEGWVVSMFERDPLNDKKWSKTQQERWQGRPQPTFSEVIAGCCLTHLMANSSYPPNSLLSGDGEALLNPPNHQSLSHRTASAATWKMRTTKRLSALTS